MDVRREHARGTTQAFHSQTSLNAHFQATQLSQSTQSANGRVAGVRFFVQIVEHLVAVVGAHGNGRFADALLLPPFLFQHNGFHNGVHIHIARQMVGFVEITGPGQCFAVSRFVVRR